MKHILLSLQLRSFVHLVTFLQILHVFLLGFVTLLFDVVHKNALQPIEFGKLSDYSHLKRFNAVSLFMQVIRSLTRRFSFSSLNVGRFFKSNFAWPSIINEAFGG